MLTASNVPNNTLDIVILSFLALATTTNNNLLIYIEFPIPLFLQYFQLLIITHSLVYTIYTIINVFTGVEH